MTITWPSLSKIQREELTYMNLELSSMPDLVHDNCWDSFTAKLKAFWTETQNITGNTIIHATSMKDYPNKIDPLIVAFVRVDLLTDDIKPLMGTERDCLASIYLAKEFHEEDCAHELAHLYMHSQYRVPWL
jgi:hypothetical protein